MSKIRFVDPGIVVNATGGSGGSSISSSYALSASYADFATSASYAVSASYEIVKEVSSSYADTASFAQSGNGIFSGSFSGSFDGISDYLPLSGGVMGGNINMDGNAVVFSTGDGIQTDGSGAINVQSDKGIFLKVGSTSYAQVRLDAFEYTSDEGFGVTLFPSTAGGGGAPFRLAADDYATAFGGNIAFPSTFTAARQWNLPDATGTIALLNSSYYSATGSFSGSFQGDGSELIGVISSSHSTTASYVETAQTASYVLNAVSSSYAVTASLAQSGNGIFSGSFSGSFEGDGSNLTGVDPFPFSGSAVITGSLLVSGSSKPLEIIGSGSTVFSVVGSLGELFAIDDQLSGSLLVVNDISGLPQFEVFSDGRTLIGADPRSLYTTATINATLAATSESIYSLSTSSYDGVFFDYTVTSASNARAGNIMSIWNGGNLVYTENTTTDIGSTVGVTFNVEISQSQAQLISLTDTAGWKIKTTIRSI